MSRPKLLTPDEAAQRLNIKRQHVLYMARAGRLRSVKLSSNVVRIFEDSVDKYLYPDSQEDSV